MTTGPSSQATQASPLDEPSSQNDPCSVAVDGLVCRIASKRYSAQVATAGGQVLQWHFDNHEMLWLTRRHVSGKPLRGGIPLCWPWFGPHRSNSGFPNHGVARTSTFQVIEHAPDRVVMQLSHGDLLAELTVCVEEALDLSLKTINFGITPQTISAAFHTYFRVSDVQTIRISGLDGTKYLDQLQNQMLFWQDGDVRFGEEVDRIYQTDGLVVIEDLSRQIVVDSCKSSNSTVVWNPWKDKSARLGDMEVDDFKRMVCVETAWAGYDVRTIAPGASMTLRAKYQCVLK